MAARVDRGGKSASRKRIETLVQELGFDGYFETSAKEGQNIAELVTAIKNAIDWEMLPKVTSTDLFQQRRRKLDGSSQQARICTEHS